MNWLIIVIVSDAFKEKHFILTVAKLPVKVCTESYRSLIPTWNCKMAELHILKYNILYWGSMLVQNTVKFFYPLHNYSILNFLIYKIYTMPITLGENLRSN